MNQYRISFSDINWESPVSGMRHKVAEDGKFKLRLVEYFPEMEPHWCSVGHIGQLLEGKLEIEFGDGSIHIFEAGDGLMIPSGEEDRHRARVLTDVVRAIFMENI